MEEPGASAAPPGPSRTVWIVVAVIIVAIVVIIAVLFAAGLFQPTGPETIKIGTILPVTGTLEDFGGPMQDTAMMAVSEINAAGGVLGMDLELVTCDSQTRPAAGNNCAARLIQTEGVIAIVGAASSGVSQAVSTLTLENNVVQISPASTSPLFTTFEVERARALGETTNLPDLDQAGYFWRTAPSDELQGQVAALVASNPDFGWSTAGIIAVNNPYGKGFADVFRSFVVDAGVDVVAQVNYTEEQASYTSDLELLAGADPDVVMFIGYPGDGITILQNWWANRASPGWDWEWIFSEGLKATDFLVDLADANIDVSGVVGTAPIFTGPNFDNFHDAYHDVYDRDPQVFDAHTYDAIYLIAAAIERAGEATSDAIRQNLVAVSGPGGTTYGPGQWSEIASALGAGNEVNYEGGSGAVDFTIVGEVTSDYEVFAIEGSVASGFAFVQDSLVQKDDLEPPTPPS